MVKHLIFCLFIIISTICLVKSASVSVNESQANSSPTKDEVPAYPISSMIAQRPVNTIQEAFLAVPNRIISSFNGLVNRLVNGIVSFQQAG